MPTICIAQTAKYRVTTLHSPDNVTFRDISLTVRGTPAHVKCYHIMPVLKGKGKGAYSSS